MYQVEEANPESLLEMIRFAERQLAGLASEESGGIEETAPASAERTGEGAVVTTAEKADRALKVLYEDGTDRKGSLDFFEAALKFPSGYTTDEIADKLGVSTDDALAFRRNLGRAEKKAIKPEVPDAPALIESWWQGGAWRYGVTEPIREAARRRGLEVA